MLTPIVIVSFAELLFTFLNLLGKDGPCQRHSSVVLTAMPLSVYRIATVVGQLSKIFHIGCTHRDQFDALLFAFLPRV